MAERDQSVQSTSGNPFAAMSVKLDGPASCGLRRLVEVTAERDALRGRVAELERQVSEKNQRIEELWTENKRLNEELADAVGEKWERDHAACMAMLQEAKASKAKSANPFGGPDAAAVVEQDVAPEKPPLGCCPRRVRTLQRAGELAGAIARYLDAGRMPKAEWTLEFEQLLGWLQQHGPIDKPGEAV